jgi:hypothetical protein
MKNSGIMTKDFHESYSHGEMQPAIQRSTGPVSDISLVWLHNRRFDLFFIMGVPTLALLTGCVIIWWPSLFLPILVFDLWLLGYHHVISTYTRLCFDRKSFSEHWWMVVLLLPSVAVATIIVAYSFGLWTVVSVYFYWLWFHYARQSWGISRTYRAKEPNALYEHGWLDQAIFYALPILGILYRSYQDPGHFIGMELRVVPIASVAVLNAAAIATVALLGIWLIRRIYACLQGRMAGTHTLYMLTHFQVFAVAYLLIGDVTCGWLVINIWHNAQYILFVWLYNTRRFRAGVDREAWFLSYISQPGRLWVYLTCCVLITGVIYWALLGTLDALFFAGLSATIVLYQIVNFHHYIVDATIWKVRREPLKRALGLKSSP